MTQQEKDPTQAPEAGANVAASGGKRRRSYRKSGAYALKRAVRELGSRTIDRRTRVGKALAEWADALAIDLGGLDGLSTAQKALIEQAATTRLLLDSIDAWLVRQPSLVDRRKRALLPVVRERQALADALVRYLTALGLERKARDVTDLASYLASRATPVRVSLTGPRADVPALSQVPRHGQEDTETLASVSATSRERSPKTAIEGEERHRESLAAFNEASGAFPPDTQAAASLAGRATSRVAEVQP